MESNGEDELLNDAEYQGEDEEGLSKHEDEDEGGRELLQDEDLEELGKEKEDFIKNLPQSKPSIQCSFKYKLIEILKNLHAAELMIYSEASKEFIRLLKGDAGGDILREYVQLSPKCSEILEAWKLHQGKPGMAHILSLISVVLDHPTGKSQSDEILNRNITNLAHAIFKEKLDDIYAELNSQERRRQNAALYLLASIVKRGSGLASEVAKVFDFKLLALSKLYGLQKRKKAGGKDAKKGMKLSSTRRAFVRFAMSFLEVGKPWLLRWILQQREMYFCVLRCIGDDDIETVVYVLSIIREKVLTEDSLVPPGLRSVLFGAITLEQLSNISGNKMAGDAAELAHRVLVMACTDPHNGLMPGSNLKGNEKRLFELMKKLRATEVGYHKELLLAIARERPYLCSSYMDEFPYNLKPRSSSSWFSAISLLSDMISSTNLNVAILSLTSDSRKPIADKPELQSILKCIIPRAFTRSLISIGLQHMCNLVKHGTLRIVLESLKSLAGLTRAIDSSCTADKQGTEKLVSLKQFIQDEVRAMLPEPQVLLKLLSLSGQKHSKDSGVGLKRCANLPEVRSKKLKLDNANADVDIIIGGIEDDDTNGPVDWDESRTENVEEELDVQKDYGMVVSDIWALSEKRWIVIESNSAEDFFQSRLLDVFTFYLRVVPIAIEGLFDFFKLLPADPRSLSTDQLQSLLSLLLECIGQAPGGRTSVRAPKLMYKHLQRIMSILTYSYDKGIRDQAYLLARAAMTSTGAFDQNFSEVDAWLLSLPGYLMKTNSSNIMQAETTHGLFEAVISFLADAISTVGNNLYKYLDQLRTLTSEIDGFGDDFPGFSPLIICALEKCLMLLESESKTYKLFVKSMISVYVCNTISLILQIQVDAKTLAGVIHSLLADKRSNYSSRDMGSKSHLCEWRPVNNLLCYASDIFNRTSRNLFLISESSITGDDSSFSQVLLKMNELLAMQQVSSVRVSVAFTSSIVCAHPDDMLTSFPRLLTVTEQYFRSHLPFLSWMLLLERSFLANVANMWQHMFFSGPKIIDHVISNHRGSNLDLLNDNEAIQSAGLDSYGAAFGLFLHQAPLCSLFSAIMNLGSIKLHPELLNRVLDILRSNSMLSLLQFKLSEASLDECIISLRTVLFWTDHITSSYETDQSDILKELCQICTSLVKYVLDHILKLVADTVVFNTSGTSSVTYAQDVMGIIIRHPILTRFLLNPLPFSRNLTKKTLGHSVQDLLSSVDIMDRNILEFLRTVLDFTFSLGKRCNWESEICDILRKLISTSPSGLVQKFFGEFELTIVDKNVELLLRYLHVLLALKQFVSPFELLKLMQVIFDKVEGNISGSKSPFLIAVSIGLYIVDGVMSMIISYLQQPSTNSEFSWFLDAKGTIFDASILLNLYHKILEFGVSFNLQVADICLLKIVTAVYNQRSAESHPALFSLHTQLSRMIINSPMKILVHCFYPVSKIKVKILLRLVEVSPTHMNLFGKTFLRIPNKDLSVLGELDRDAWLVKCKLKRYLSNDDYMLLLPVALSYLKFVIHKYGKHKLKPLDAIPKLYSGILFEGFSNWKDFVSQDIFQDDYDESVLTSVEDFQKFCSNTLLGKAVIMLHYFFIFSASSLEEKYLLRIFDSIYVDASLFDDLDVSNLKNFGFKDALRILDFAAAKLSFTRLLLFPPQSSIQSPPMEANRESNKGNSKRLERAKAKFMSILVNTLDIIVKEFPLRVESSGASCVDCYPVFRFLEHHILSNIIQLCKVRSTSFEVLSNSFLDKFIGLSLHHRFEDPVTLRAIRFILVALSEARYSAKVMALVVEHPKFVATILGCYAYSDSSTIIPSGLLQPIPSILKFLDVCRVEQTIQKGEAVKLEVLKLLRILHYLKGTELNVDDMSSRELLALLLSGYTATQSEIDLEMFQLMHEIEMTEGVDCGIIADMDYLWGNSALKLKKEQILNGLTSEVEDDNEMIERRQIFFRENVPVDSKLSAMTVLHFCGERSSGASPKFLEGLLEDNCLHTSEKNFSSNMSMAQTYNPAFILRFSNFCLLMGYLEPIEFCRLGLLAISFVSISSPDEELRKLGYGCLGRFKKGLENYQKRKDTLQLQLLLTYIQNGITQEWQRIPSVIAVFAAEASLTFLDPSHHHFLTLSEFLVHSHRMNLEMIPLFPKLFRSGSIHFKTDRLWILQLLYVGLISKDDARIYQKQKVLKVLLSFYASSLSDPESKILILKIVKKWVTIDPCVIKGHGLLPWLSSILLICGERLVGDQKEYSLQVMELVMKVVNDAISSAMVCTWLQEVALEQLSELSSQLLSMLMRSLKFLKRNVQLVNSSLNAIVSTLEISQRRLICFEEGSEGKSTPTISNNKEVMRLREVSQNRLIYQPRFTLSLVGLLLLYQALHVELSDVETSATSEIRLKIILMSPPLLAVTHKDRATLAKLLMLAVPAALQLSSIQRSPDTGPDHDFLISFKEQHEEESFVSKLLRWATASVILGVITNRFSAEHTVPSVNRSNMDSLQSVLEEMVKNECDSGENDSCTNQALINTLLYLQQLIGMNCSFSSSVILALCLLLLGNLSKLPGTRCTTLNEISDAIISHSSKIYCPPEVNPSWTWSFDQPWKDECSSLRTKREKAEEEQACRSILIMFATVLDDKSFSSSGLSYEDLERFGLYEWERDMFLEPEH